jgi:hypothetical protein
MVGFDAAFASFAAETNVTPARVSEMRTALSTYYTGEFATEYKAQNKTATFDAGSPSGQDRPGYRDRLQR